jgi:tRNA U34 5-methylaminomethyl-2-thiouridine-forming methyltransferase MnmC
LNFETADTFKLIYFDAFAPNAQPELWTKEIFEKMFAMLEPEGVLVTYCSKGDVRRAMQAAGFNVEKLPGPKGKREMIRARKNQD